MTKTPFPLESTTYDIGRLTSELYLVKREVRPAAHITIRKECLKQALALINKQGLKYVSEPCGDNHFDLIVFKRRHLSQIISLLRNIEGPLKHWCLGKLFGYSEAEIGRYLRRDKN